MNQTISDYNDTDYSLLGYPNFTLLGLSSNSSNNDWFQQQQLPSVMLNYSYTNYGDIVNNTEIITVYNDKVYHIIFSADESRYDEMCQMQVR